MGLRIKDWNRFQHFKDRRPPWVKLYRDLLDDMDWHELDPVAAKALVMLWLIASEDDGNLPDTRKLSFRLRMTEAECNALICKLSHWLERDDNGAISPRYQSDAPETETETETETDARAAPSSSAAVVDAYHRILPGCQRAEVLNDKRRKRIAAAVKLAKQVCAQQGWPYDPGEFWGAYFTECSADPWMRGEVPNPKNANWRQNLDVLLAEDRFAGVMDRAIASMRGGA